MSALLARLAAREQRRCTHIGTMPYKKVSGDWRHGWLYWCSRCGAFGLGPSEGDVLDDMTRPDARKVPR